MERPGGELPMGTVTFLFSDIEGSTRMAAELGPDVYRELLERHHAALRGAFHAHDGVERGTQGDSFFVVFRDAPSAVAAAVEGQLALAATRFPAGEVVRVRMGIHTGEGIAGGDDYVGIDINRAARIAGVAHGGQVLLSDATRALAERSLPVTIGIRDLGMHGLKDLEVPEHLFQLVVPDLPSDFPPPRSARRAIGNLPARMTSFIGRERDLAMLASLVRERRLVTLVGPGGTGKTSLAVELARGVADGFEDGAWLASFDAIGDPGLAGSVIIAALGLRDTTGRPARDRLLDNLAGRQLLLVLDNFEHVMAAADLVAAILATAPAVTILATSRAQLHLAAEQTYSVDPLELPAPSVVDPEMLGGVAAIELFLDRVRRARPGFRLTAENGEATIDICRLVDGLPLGIELAAARVALLGPHGVRDRLARHLDLPGSTVRDAPARQRTLRATVAWSLDLLDDASRTLFEEMAVFAGGCRPMELEAVCGSGESMGPDVLEMVATLVDQSLVRASMRGPYVRFEMLETIRAEASDRLLATRRQGEVARRHALAYLAMAEADSPSLLSHGQAAVMERFSAERDNFRAALSWAVEVADSDVGMRLSTALGWFWGLLGEIEEARRSISIALAIPGAEAPTHARMRALEAAGTIAYYGGDMEAAAGWYRAQLDLARELDDPLGTADALFNIPFTRPPTEFMENRALLQQADDLYRSLGDDLKRARVKWTIGAGLQLNGQRDEAKAVWIEALAESRRLGDARYESLGTSSLGVSALEAGDREEAAHWFFQALGLSREMRDAAGITLAMPIAAAATLELAGPEPAATILGAYETLSRRFGVRPPLGLTAVIQQIDARSKIRDLLDPATYDAAMDRGRRMDPDEAAAFVFEQAARFGVRTALPGEAAP